MNAAANALGSYGFLSEVLEEYMDPTLAHGVINYAFKRANLTVSGLQGREIPETLVTCLSRGVDMFVRDELKKTSCKTRVLSLVGTRMAAVEEGQSECAFADIDIGREDDIVTARNQARNIAEKIGFSRTEQIKIATVVSELARNIIKYAGNGRVRVEQLPAPNRGLRIVAADHGQGIADLQLILSGKYRSKTGLGLGILGVKKLMDEFMIQTGPRGTVVSAIKRLA